MPKLEDSVTDFIRSHGPSTALEITRGVGASSFIISAILVDAVEQRKLMKSKKNKGENRIYYFKEQIDVLKNRIVGILTDKDKKLLQKIANDQIICEHEINQDDVPLMNQLEDLVGSFMAEYNDYRFKCWHIPELTEDKAKEILATRMSNSKEIKGLEGVARQLTDTEKFLEQKFQGVTSDNVVKVEIPEVAPKTEETAKEKVEEPEPEVMEKVEEPVKEVEKVTEQPEEKPEEEKKTKSKQKKLVEALGSIENDEFMDKVMNWFERENIEVQKEKTIKAGKVYEIDAKIPTPLGKQHYLIRVLNYGKKKVPQADVSALGTEAASKRTPAILISATGFAKSATKYWKKELEDSLILVGKDDLD